MMRRRLSADPLQRAALLWSVMILLLTGLLLAVAVSRDNGATSVSLDAAAPALTAPADNRAR